MRAAGARKKRSRRSRPARISAKSRRTFSDAQDAVKGGDLGWRTPARLPSVFVERVKDMKKGDVSPVLRSPGGFHIVKLNDLRSRNAPTVVEQTHAAHILVRVNETTSETEASAKIDRIRDRIDTGAKFADQAQAQFRGSRRRPRAATSAGSAPATRCPSSSRR